jgi:hypothetical protein
VYINGKMIQLFIGRVRCKRITHSPFTSALRVLCPDAEFVFLSPLKRNFTFFALGTFLAPAFAVVNYIGNTPQMLESMANSWTTYYHQTYGSLDMR